MSQYGIPIFHYFMLLLLLWLSHWIDFLSVEEMLKFDISLHYLLVYEHSASHLSSFTYEMWFYIHSHTYIYFTSTRFPRRFFLLLSFVPLFSPPLPTNNKEFLPPVLASQSVIKFATIRCPYGRISASVCHACSFIHFCFWFRLHLEFDLVWRGR